MPVPAGSIPSTPTGSVSEASAKFWWRSLGAAFLLCALTAVAYWPSLHGDFILDDDILLTSNDLIKNPGGLHQIWFTTAPTDYWPVTNTSLWLEWRLWGMNPTGYHATNLVLHIVSALLIWQILRRLQIPGAFLGALLFAIHPLCVESVAWIAQRKNTLSMLFFLIAIYAWLKSEKIAREPIVDISAELNRSPTSDQTPKRTCFSPRAWYWLSFLAFIAAMLSKGSVAILPLFLLVLCWWQEDRITRGDLRRTAPFFAAALALTFVNIWFQTHGSGIPIRTATFWQRLTGAAAAIWFYLYKSIIPVDLTFIYPNWQVESDQWHWWLPLLAVAAVTAALYWLRRNRWFRPVFCAWMAFCIALAPAVGFADVGFMKFSLVADRYTYIALIAPMALIAAACTLWYRQATGLLRLAAAIVIAFLISTRTYLTWHRGTLFSDPITLYQATLAKNPNSWLLHNNLGSAYSSFGWFEAAIDEYQLALDAERPDDARIRYNYGNALAGLGRYPEAIEQYRMALQIKPDDARSHNNLGSALHNSQQFEAAEKAFRTALKLQPFFPEANANLGTVLLDEGRAAEAVGYFLQAVQQRPSYSKAWYRLADAYLQTGESKKALLAARRALALAESQAQTELAERIRAWLAAPPSPKFDGAS